MFVLSLVVLEFVGSIGDCSDASFGLDLGFWTLEAWGLEI